MERIEKLVIDVRAVFEKHNCPCSGVKEEVLKLIREQGNFESAEDAEEIESEMAIEKNPNELEKKGSSTKEKEIVKEMEIEQNPNELKKNIFEKKNDSKKKKSTKRKRNNEPKSRKKKKLEEKEMKKSTTNKK